MRDWHALAADEALRALTSGPQGLSAGEAAERLKRHGSNALVTLGLALAFEPAEPGVMRRPPRARLAPLLSGFLLWRVVLVTCLFVGAALGVFFWRWREAANSRPRALWWST